MENKAKKNDSDMHINWYPGHMKKTREEIIENMRLVDVAIEIVDARAPYSSSNPDIDQMIAKLPKVVVLNKEDLAEERETRNWMSSYRRRQIEAVSVNSINGRGIRELMQALERQSEELFEKLQSKGRKKRALRVIIVGIPNVGKSSLINRMVGKKTAKTGDRPGITRGKQWIKLKGDMELLDTPGVLWPKMEDQKAAMNLAFLGSIKDQTMEIEEIAIELMRFLWIKKPQIYSQRFGFSVQEMCSLEELMNAMASRRGYMLSGGRIDYSRLSNAFLMDFRNGKLGKITLETPEDINV